MAYILDIRTYNTRGVEQIYDPNYGKTSIIESSSNDFPFEIKRLFYIYESKLGIKRAGHRHKKAVQGLVCIQGVYEVFSDDGVGKTVYTLDSPQKLLVIEPKDWHTMESKTDNAMLLVISSEHYDINDYIDEKYTHD